MSVNVEEPLIDRFKKDKEDSDDTTSFEDNEVKYDDFEVSAR